MAGPDPAPIAIVDDDDGARDALHFLLDVLGCRAMSFASALEFLAAEPNRFACAILDQHMPDMTGIELAQRLRAQMVTIPIMLISGNLTDEIVDLSAKVGIQLASEKPPGMDVLSSFLHKALN